MTEVDAGRVRIGTSGWTYDQWQGSFNPDGLAKRRRLEYLATRFDAAEVNGTFYSLQRASAFRAWAAATGEGFRFAVKGSRYITHMKRLRDVDEALGRFLASGPLALGEKLGPVLWQLPPALRWDEELVTAFLGSEAALAVWAVRVRAWPTGESSASADTIAPGDPAPAVPRDVWVFFDNDGGGHAPRDALALAAMTRTTARGPVVPPGDPTG